MEANIKNLYYLLKTDTQGIPFNVKIGTILSEDNFDEIRKLACQRHIIEIDDDIQIEKLTKEQFFELTQTIT